MTLSASLQEMLVSSSDYALSNIYTSIPGVIVGIKNMGQLCVDVQPTINVRTQGGEENTQRPPILNVPYQQPLSPQGGLTFPVAVGDTVWLNFSMRGLEVWKRSSGESAAPADMRTFDPRDCIATPAYPFGLSPNQPNKRSLPHDPSDVVLVHNIGTGAEVEVRLKKGSGEVEINSPTKVTVNCVDAEVNASSSTTVNTTDFSVNSSNFTVNSGNVSFSSGTFLVGTGTYGITASDSANMTANFSQTGSYTLNGIVLETHTHGGVESGGSNTAGPQ
jgi:hypothetical protein